MNIITIEPTKTYATRANAEKAVTKWFAEFFPDCKERVCNATILQHTDGRFFVLICNIDHEHFARMIHVVIRGGFNMIN
jgi:hypothetical protein